MATLEVDKHVRNCAVALGDSNLLAKLSAGDMVALDAKYHKKCLVGLYNHARKVNCDRAKSDETEIVSGIAFAELVMFVEETYQLDQTSAPVFRLNYLAQLYMSRLEQLRISDATVHTTRLKQRLLAQIPNLRAYKSGRDVLLVYENDVGAAIGKACAFDNDDDAIQLARAANIVRRQFFLEKNSKPFTGFPMGCQKESVPTQLLALVSMILEGTIIEDQSECVTHAALSIAQLLKFNSVKHKRKQTTTITDSVCVRHSCAMETPVPIYIGLMLHAHTRKKELVDKLYNLGMSISYDRVLRLSAQMGNNICEQFNRDHVVCPPSLRGNLFTSAAVDNIDHNPSSTTSKESFHGTGISLFQYPAHSGDGVLRHVENERCNTSSKSLSILPQFYTEVPVVTSSIKSLLVPPSTIVSLTRSSFQQHIDQEHLWLDHIQKSNRD